MIKNYIYDNRGWIIGETIIYDEAIPPSIDKTGKRIALVVGHDVNKKGAYGDLGISEWDFNNTFIRDLNDDGMLPDMHTYILFQRDETISGYTDKMIDLHNRIDAENCDISIEFHFNGASDSSIHGNEVLYCSGSGKELADKLDFALDSLPNRDRGVKKVSMNENGGGFCCRGKSVAIISEPFFGSHQSLYGRECKYRKTLLLAYKDFFNSL